MAGVSPSRQASLPPGSPSLRRCHYSPAEVLVFRTGCNYLNCDTLGVLHFFIDSLNVTQSKGPDPRGGGPPSWVGPRGCCPRWPGRGASGRPWEDEGGPAGSGGRRRAERAARPPAGLLFEGKNISLPAPPRCSQERRQPDDVTRTGLAALPYGRRGGCPPRGAGRGPGVCAGWQSLPITQPPHPRCGDPAGPRARPHLLNPFTVLHSVPVIRLLPESVLARARPPSPSLGPFLRGLQSPRCMGWRSPLRALSGISFLPASWDGRQDVGESAGKGSLRARCGIGHVVRINGSSIWRLRGGMAFKGHLWNRETPAESPQEA